MREVRIRLPVLSPALLHREARRCADADHQAAAMDEAVYGDGEIQRGEAVRAHAGRDKIRIGQDVTGQRDHPGHAR